MKKKIIVLITMLALIVLSGCSSQDHLEDELHDYSIEIEGQEMKLLTVEQVADLWEINSELLLNEIVKKFDFKEEYTIDSTLDEMRVEYKFSPAMIKDIAEEMKQQAIFVK